jgi:outer membrane protein assembly factor BamB
MNKLLYLNIYRCLAIKIIFSLLISCNPFNLLAQETKCIVNYNNHKLIAFKKLNKNYFYLFERTASPMHKVILCLDSTAQVISSKVAVNIPTIRNIIDIDSSNYLICGSGYLIKMNQNYSTIWRKKFTYRKPGFNQTLSNNKMYQHDSIVYLLSSFNSGNVLSTIDTEGNVKWSYDLNAPKNNLLASQLMSNGDMVVVLNIFQSYSTKLNIIRFTEAGEIKYSKLIEPPYPYTEITFAEVTERNGDKILIATNIVANSPYIFDFKLAFLELSIDGEVNQTFTTRSQPFNHFIRDDTNTVAVFKSGAHLLFYQIPDTISDLFLIESSRPLVNFTYNQSEFQETVKKNNENFWLSGKAVCGSKSYFGLDIRTGNYEGACHNDVIELEFPDESFDYEITNFNNIDSISITTINESLIGFPNYTIPLFQDLCLGCDTLNISSLKENNEFKIFPNPLKDFLQIQFTAEPKNQLQVQIYDLSGRLLQNESLQRGQLLYQIAVGGLNEGAYLLQINDGEKQARKVFVKNK